MPGATLRKVGWACGYTLSIFGNEYYQQCPFQTGNGYGDGRAVSVLEAVINSRRWEMQLKGGGTTPYCRGADGRAVCYRATGVVSGPLAGAVLSLFSTHVVCPARLGRMVCPVRILGQTLASICFCDGRFCADGIYPAGP